MSSTENNYVNTDLGNVALNSCGEYNADSSYEYLDTVNYEGGSYFCKVEFPKKISGIAPKAGVSTEFWQLLTIPGDATSEYIKLHDEVVNKAKKVETSRAAVELSQTEVEAAQADVSQMRQDTQEAAEEAASSRDSAAGYAQSAETSRTAAKESEDNINAQVTEFDTHVAEKTSAAETAITEARRAAVNAVSTKQDDATQAVTDEGDKQIKNVEDAGTEQIGKAKSAGASAVSAAGAAGVSAVNAVKAQQTASIKAVADEGTQQVTAVNTAGSTQVSTIETKGADQVKAIQEASENALQNISNGVDKGLSEEGKAADAKATGEAISNLTEDLINIDSLFEKTKLKIIDLGNTIIRSNNTNNNLSSSVYGYAMWINVDNPIYQIKINTKSSVEDNLICELRSKDGETLYEFDKQAISTEYSDITFSFNKITRGIIKVLFYSENGANIAFCTYSSNPYSSSILYDLNGDGIYDLQHKFVGGWSTGIANDHRNLQGVSFNVICADLPKNISIKDSIKSEIITKMNYIYVSTTGNDTTGDGTKENPFATIYHANEVITDNSKENQYTIVVGNGTYTDLQEKYSGMHGDGYEGVICKDYVCYESENILRPDLCVIKWNGATGFTLPVTDKQVVDKCPFHICKNTHTHIKGFTLDCQNTRYCQHIETTGATVPCEWLFENVIFKWNGRPDEENAYSVARSCVGTGYTYMEKGTFRNCQFLLTNEHSNNHMVFQSHDNLGNINTPLTIGEKIVFENCYISVADGSNYALFDLRQSQTSPKVTSSVVLDNVDGIPLYISNGNNYGVTLIGCTEKVN